MFSYYQFISNCEVKGDAFLLKWQCHTKKFTVQVHCYEARYVTISKGEICPSSSLKGCEDSSDSNIPNKSIPCIFSITVCLVKIIKSSTICFPSIRKNICFLTKICKSAICTCKSYREVSYFVMKSTENRATTYSYLLSLN